MFFILYFQPIQILNGQVFFFDLIYTFEFLDK